MVGEGEVEGAIESAWGGGPRSARERRSDDSGAEKRWEGEASSVRGAKGADLEAAAIVVVMERGRLSGLRAGVLRPRLGDV